MNVSFFFLCSLFLTGLLPTSTESDDLILFNVLSELQKSYKPKTAILHRPWSSTPQQRCCFFFRCASPKWKFDRRSIPKPEMWAPKRRKTKTQSSLEEESGQFLLPISWSYRRRRDRQNFAQKKTWLDRGRRRTLTAKRRVRTGSDCNWTTITENGRKEWNNGAKANLLGWLGANRRKA